MLLALEKLLMKANRVDYFYYLKLYCSFSARALGFVFIQLLIFCATKYIVGAKLFFVILRILS